MAHILIVDDEQNILNALRRELEPEHDVEAFTSPREALRRADETEFDLVMSDYQMPEMDGTVFLERFAQRQPDAMRLILSGHADVDALIKAVSLSHPYRFVEKPWSAADLEVDIKQSLKHRDVMLENRRLASSCKALHGAAPAAPGQKNYRIMLATKEANDADLMKRELTASTARGAMQGTGSYEMHGCFPHGGEHFQAEVDCVSQQQVLGQMEHEVYDLVIIDSLMLDRAPPGFLEEMSRRSPESAHILISGAVDMDVLVSAINRVQIDDFLRRPWTACELKAVVLRALHYRDLRLENRRLANLFRQQEKQAL